MGKKAWWLMTWWFWLIIAASYILWGVYQVVWGHLWMSMLFDAVFAGFCVFMAIRSKKRWENTE